MSKKLMDKSVINIGINVVATIRDAESGEVKRVVKTHNIIPTVGRKAIANHLTNTSPDQSDLRINKVAVGTDGTAVDNADTKLGTETYRNNVASQTNSDNVAYITGFFGATETTGTFEEAGLFIEGTAGADSGVLLSHVLISVTKSNTETLTIDWTITIS